MTAVLEASLSGAEAERRLVLARAAAHLFRERGYDRTTAMDIARASGCSRRTFFRHFESKADVVLVDVEAILGDFRRHLSPLSSGATRWQQIRAGLHAAIRCLADPPCGLQELTIAAWLDEPAVASRFGLVVAQMERQIAAALCDDTGIDPDQDLSVQFQARGAMAAYLAAARLHTATGADIGDLFEESISMLERLLADGDNAQ